MDETPEKEFSWAPIVIAVVVIAVAAFTIWVIQDKKHQREHEEVLVSMDKELVADEKAVKEERRKLEELTKSVEELRVQIQYGQVKNGKTAVEEFNKKAAEQRAQRDKFVQMAEQYNQKVARFRQLQQ